ncbi:putative oxidoreductase YhxC [Metarhizium anisopliae]|nr:putative oxidoreductase YhxC [Metarhizium anisopliae]
MEGAKVAVVYIPAEEDAQHTKAQVAKNRGEIVLISSDLSHSINCTDVAERIKSTFGTVDILANNAASRNEKGTIFDISDASVDPYIGVPSGLDYATTKAAIIAYTRSLSNYLIKKGIRVNAVAAGPVWTPSVASGVEKPRKHGHGLGNWTPMDRIGQLVEVATSYIFLAGNESQFMSGETLHPNGGIVVNG